jgi:class 3 adenylate cyclase/predicted ATPase
VDIAAWLRELRLERYEEAFRENEIDAEILPKLTADDLRDIGVTTVGHRRKLLEAIATLAAPALAPQAEPSAPAEALPRARLAEAERRQLTVLFCDLVGSTELAGRLDPEDLGKAVRAYQNAVAAEVVRFEGHVAKYMGDGVLAYFGYPKAHEDDAERAVRAGLAITGKIDDLSTGVGKLSTRIGIATGRVVVGDLIGEGAAQEEAVVGETPNLASRLQGLAEPDSVVIAAGTRRLLGGLFELADLGAYALKGFSEPIRAWRVVGAGAAESRFEALHGERLTPLVGREHELGILLERWEWAKDGEGQIVLLSGEPGIGKSRLTRSLIERLADEPHIRLRYYCSPYHTNSALYPVIDQMERASGFQTEDTGDIRLDKLEAVLAQATEGVAAVAPLIAALLSIPTGARYPPAKLTPEAQKLRTFDALLGQVEGLAGQRPVLMVLEDAQWIDPTSVELFGLVINRIQRLPVLLLITSRPEFTPPWTGYAHLTPLTLSRLGQRQGAQMVERLTGGKPLPAEVLEQILAKTDGVPLFVEELTKTVLESGLLVDAGDHFELSGALLPLAIPTTLHDSLLARLDRLAPVKEVAQIGAVIGREFPYELLAAVVALSDEQLQDALAQLVESELIFRRGVPPDATYAFKHALVQDTAYQSLLKSKRKQFHAQIARSLEEHFLSAVNSEPELLAHHYTQAELPLQAISYWLSAGRKASERCSDLEAVAHLTRGLELVEHLPDPRERAVQELDLRIALGPALMNTKGSAAPEVAAVYERAEELCREVGSPEQAFPVLWGLWFQHQTSGLLRIAGKLADELIKVAEELPDTVYQLQGRHAAWTTHCVAGEFAVAQRHVQQGLALYDPDRHPSSAFIYGGHDAGVCGYSSGALNEWALGYPDRALHSAREGVALAARLGHPFSSAQALCYKAILHQLRGEPAAVAQDVDKLLAHCIRHDLKIWASNGQILQGWTLLTNDEVEEGLRRSREALDARRTTGVTHRQAYYLALLAEGLASVGRAQEGLVAVTEALKCGTEDRRWEALAHRVQGDLLLAMPSKDSLAAEEALRRAIEIARRQEARSHELRAATSLARLWADQGKHAEALDLLAPIYAWFTEGFDTADLKDAKALLDELS